MKSLRDFEFKEKRVLVRFDFNVPLSQKGEILDDFRIKKALPTIEYLKEKGGKIILISHLGRPKDKEQKYSLKPVAQRLEKLLNQEVEFLPDCIGKKVERKVEKMVAGEIALLENIRFYKEEEENNLDFTKALSKLGDIFINDAFSVSHRAHASVVGLTELLPSGAGLLLEKEIKTLSQILKNPKRPLVVIVGGKKVKDKAKVVEKFSQLADVVLVGNLIAKEIKEKKVKVKKPERVFFPLDPKNNLDIGEKTIELFKEKIKNSKTVFWAGPLGKIEVKEFQKSSKEIGKAIAESGSFSVVGGGDTIEFLNKIGLLEKFDHVSIGGGAMLMFLSGEKLPGLRALSYGRD